MNEAHWRGRGELTMTGHLDKGLGSEDLWEMSMRVWVWVRISPRPCFICINSLPHGSEVKLIVVLCRCERRMNGVTVCQCASVTVWWCDSVTVWQCDSATVWQCDSVTVWQCDSVMVCQCACLTVRRCDGATVRRCDGVTVWCKRRLTGVTVRRWERSTVLLAYAVEPVVPGTA